MRFRCNIFSLVTKIFVTFGHTLKGQNTLTFKCILNVDINVSDGQLLMIYCSLIKRFVQILLSSNLNLFGKENMSP